MHPEEYKFIAGILQATNNGYSFNQNYSIIPSMGKPHIDFPVETPIKQ
jgi:hypothetical protein